MPATPRQDLIDWNEPDPLAPPVGRRRRVGGIVTATLLLATTGIAVTSAGPGEKIGRGSAGTPATIPADVEVSEESGERFDTLFVQFVDRDHGFALTATCPGGEQSCSYGLAVSTDGGRSHQHRALPLAKIPPLEGYSAELHAITARTVVIEDRGKWWVSTDAGRTWRSAADSGARQGAEIPTAGRLHLRCADANCDHRELTVIDPDTGMRVKVPPVPLARVHGSSESTIAPDGTRWISGIARGGEPALAMTRDGGASWSVSRFPDPGQLLHGPSLVVGPGDLRYAVFSVQREDAKNGFGPLYRSTDAGRTWTRIRAGAGEPASILGAMVRPDGRLLIGTERDGPMISADEGRTFTRLGSGSGLSYFIARGGMVTAMSLDGSYHTSSDGGTTWSPCSVQAP